MCEILIYFCSPFVTFGTLQKSKNIRIIIIMFIAGDFPISLSSLI
jgi:hypothetical protein